MASPLAQDDGETARDRVTRVFQYLKALHEHRSPVTRQIGEQPWHRWLHDLPNHHAVKRGSSVADQDGDGGETEPFILSVRRPAITRAPSPPREIIDWVVGDRDDPDKEVEVRRSQNTRGIRGDTVTARFEDDPSRPAILKDWLHKRSEWADAERPARAAMRLFEELYELHGSIEREGERVELVLGDGILNWRRNSGGILHPILLQRAQLVFDPLIPEFAVVETDHLVELYSALFQSDADVDGAMLAELEKEVGHGAVHPLDGDSTNGFLRRLVARLSARGEFQSTGMRSTEAVDPVISRAPVLFLRNRALGLSASLQRILEDLNSGKDLPPSLVSVVGIEPPTPEVHDDGPVHVDPVTGEPEDVLLSKAANREQIRIAQQLDHHNSVLVQGPPGTGKSHTIANLVGHLLAQGKKVLVTSHTTKALRVLRDHVVEELRPLCVSVLDNDIDSRRQLENAVTAIVDRLSRSDYGHLAREAEAAADVRGDLFDRLTKTRAALRDARASEYEDITLGGEKWSPSDAARIVGRDAESHGWIPGKAERGVPLPLSEAEITALYSTNVAVSAEDEAELGETLPELSELPSPEQFSELLDQQHKYESADATFGEEWWRSPPGTEGTAELAECELHARKVIAPLLGDDRWERRVIAAGRRGENAKSAWQSLVKLVASVNERALHAEENQFRFGPVLATGLDLIEQQRLLESVLHQLTDRDSLSSIWVFFHPKIRDFIATTRINDAVPERRRHFEVLLEQVHLALSRRELVQRWARQMESIGAPSASGFGSQPELICDQFASQILQLLEWTEIAWRPLESTLQRHGLSWEDVLRHTPPRTEADGDLLRLRDAVDGPLCQALSARQVAVWRRRIAAVLNGWLEYLDNSQQWGASDAARQLRDALRARDPHAYRDAFLRFSGLLKKRETVAQRRRLLDTLATSASGWAEQIRGRMGVHGMGTSPGIAHLAWQWKQLNDELDRRARVSIPALEWHLQHLADELRGNTAVMIDRFAWAAQLRRTTLSARQALVGWADIMRRIGRGTGKRVPTLLAQARQNMAACREAVPVWIMPLARVADNFDARTTRFDVVIIDEASQSDIMALLAFYLGKQVVVVGDHEQVSPVAVGQDQATVGNLIARHLRGIPNAVLYDGKMSVYDLARASFGGTICLLEHFRCVPEIIGFSNSLSYDGRIKPLRESSGSILKPHVVAHHAGRAYSERKTNEIEAKAVTSLLLAAVDHDEYREKTFGVISLVGDEQAFRIEQLLLQHMEPAEHERRRIVCGNAAQFQGDERDVMFLSVVDAPQDGPLALRQDNVFKQRFNVAASRARDQMWVVHSLNPATDLKPGDLRRRLIEYATNPDAAKDAQRDAARRTESEFEKQVADRLIAAGYRVRCQVPVGFYRIDMVVEGGSKRLALECDGDRFHPIEKLQQDMARQAVLERLGWRFIRIRGSQFFRDPQGAMVPIFEALEGAGVEPEGHSACERSSSMLSTELIERVIRRASQLRVEWGWGESQG